jgi:hypothetical protein
MVEFPVGIFERIKLKDILEEVIPMKEVTEH